MLKQQIAKKLLLEKLRHKYYKIAVLMGGDSSEREVSLLSGNSVLQSLLGMKLNAFAFDFFKEDWQTLLAEKPDLSIIMLHGSKGEDGQVQAWHQLNNIAYTGSDFSACCVAMNKEYAKAIWQNNGLYVPKAVLVANNRRHKNILQLVANLQYPLIIKPNSGGSSIGLFVVKNPEELETVWQQVLDSITTDILIEEFISGKEYTVSILAGELLPVINIKTANGIYDYDAKYEVDTTEFMFASLDAQQENKIKDIALFALQLIGANGWGRVDFILNEQNNEFYLLEANLVPGMTSHSLLPFAADHAGYDYEHVLLKLINAT